MSTRFLFVLTSAFALAISSPSFAQQGRGNMPGRGGNMPAPAASMTVAGDFANDFAAQEDLILKAANAMPAEHFDFKPTAPQQTFGERLMHVVMVNDALIKALGGKTPAPMINMQAKSKADVMMALKQSFDWGLATVKEFNDQQMVERVTPPRFMGPSASRARLISFSMVHSEDIYGQMVVYLRLNGVTPPASAAP